MRSVLSVVSAVLLGTSVLFLSSGGVAHADFHCMRIHAVMAGFNGNNNVQYVELRMAAPGQANLSGHIIQFYDGSNVLKATFTFPSMVMSASTGDSILIATTEFNGIAAGGSADFTFAGHTTGSGDVNHPVQSPGGKVVFQPAPVFNCGNPTNEVDSVAYGTATPNFGPGAAAALPNPSDNRALRLDALTYPATNNSTHNTLAAVSSTTFGPVASGNLASDLSTPRNNGRFVLKLTTSVPPSVGGVAQNPNLPAATAETAERAGGAGHTGTYLLSGVIACIALACIAGWYMLRRRST